MEMNVDSALQLRGLCKHNSMTIQLILNISNSVRKFKMQVCFKKTHLVISAQIGVLENYDFLKM